MKKLIEITVAIGAIAILVACGGGSSSGGAPPIPIPTPVASVTLVVSASNSGPISSAAVQVVDSRGQSPSVGTTDSSGNFTATIDPNVFPPPYAIGVTASGASEDRTYVGLYTANTSGTARVNKLTTAIATSISSTGKATDLLANAAREMPAVTQAKITTAEQAYRIALTPLLTAAGISPATENLLQGPLTQSTATLERNLFVQIRASGEVALVSSQAMMEAGDTGVVKSLELAQGLLPGSADQSKLPAPAQMVGQADLEALRLKMNSCFTVPAAQRGTYANPHPNCTYISSDYLDNGWTGSAELDTALASTASDNMTFRAPTFYYHYSSSKVRVGWTGVGLDGRIKGSWSTAIEKTASGWLWRGNQQKYGASVTGGQTRRVSLNTPNSRYEIGIYTSLGNVGNFEKPAYVMVVGAGMLGAGQKLIWQENCGGLVTATNNLDDATGTPSGCGNELVLQTKLISNETTYLPATSSTAFRSPQLTDAEILTVYNPYTYFRYDLKRVDRSLIASIPARLAVRPATFAEMKSVAWADFSAASKDMVTKGNAAYYTGGGNPSLSWTIPNFGMRPTSLTFSHSGGTDSASFASGALTATVTCTSNTNCNTDGTYMSGKTNWMSYFALKATDQNGVAVTTLIE